MKHLECIIFSLPLHTLNKTNGTIAQLVEQRTENPCVPGSIPGGTTENQAATLKVAAFLFSETKYLLPILSLLIWLNEEWHYRILSRRLLYLQSFAVPLQENDSHDRQT